MANHSRFFLGMGAILTLNAIGVHSALALEYTITALNFSAESINNAGQITGESGAIGTNSCVWTPGPGGGTLTNLPASLISRGGLAINSLGQISGLGSNGKTPLWTFGPDGYSVTNLGDVNSLGSEDIWATGINDSGAVVGAGWDFYGGGGWTAFLWKPTVPNGTSGTTVSLGKLPGFAPPIHTINNLGQVALSANHAILWNPDSPNATTGTMVDLGSLTGPTGTSLSRDINSAGQIVGTSTVGTTSHAFLWTPTTANGVTGNMIDLGDLPGDDQGSKAFAINLAGTVVGKSGEGINSETISGNAIIWTPDGGPQNLNDLVDQTGAQWTLTSAVDINDQGWIIGTGQYDPDGPGGTPASYRSFLLTPVPEPASLWLMLLGAAALCTRRKNLRSH